MIYNVFYWIFVSVCWLSYGAESAYVHFEQPEMVQKPRAAAVLAEEGGLVVKNYIAVLEAVEGKALKKNEGQQNLDKFHN